MFTRSTTIPTRQLEAIDRAYRRAGLPLPNRVVEARRLIESEPTAADIGASLALEAFTTTDKPQKFAEDALARMQRAQAADALRVALAQAEPQAHRASIGGLLTQAVNDLSPAFLAVVDELSKAAATLDHDNPLSVENAVRDDATRPMKAAQAALTSLGVFASIYVNRAVRGISGPLSNVLPILSLPACAVEIVADSFATVAPVLNANELAGTYAVRDMARAVEKDTDYGLLAVARGDFPGVTLALGDGAEQTRRAREAGRAFARSVAATAQRRAVVVA